MIAQLFRFLAWELNLLREERKLPEALRAEFRRIEKDKQPINCPFCNLTLTAGRSFRWHVSGCEKQEDFQ